MKEREITLDRLEEVEWGEGRGIMHINCSLPQENVLACDAQERIRNWDVSREYIFSKLGIVSTRTFHTKSISAKKYYKVRKSMVKNYCLRTPRTLGLLVLIKLRFHHFTASWCWYIERRKGRENAYKRRHDSNWKGGGKWRPFRWRRGWWLVETRLVARVIPAMQLRSTFKET